MMMTIFNYHFHISYLSIIPTYHAGDNRKKEEWDQCLIPYLQAIFPSSADTAQLVADEVTAEGTSDDDIGAVECR